MIQTTRAVTVRTRGAGLYEITRELKGTISASGVQSGLVTVFCRHTSCSLLVQENADPDVRADLQEFFSRLAPHGMAWVTHTTEGPDDMPAHIRAALTQTSISIPILSALAALGTWQGLYLFEHRAAPHERSVIFHVIGEA